jgi:hypothetical protein
VTVGCHSDEQRWLPLQIQGSRHMVNIPDGRRIRIGCECHTPEYWAVHYQAIANGWGYTIEQTEEYKRYIDLAVAMIAEAGGKSDE